jgi:hypothetical protein
MSQQLTLLPELDDVPGQQTGIVYLMTDMVLVKPGWTGRGLRQRSGELRAYIVGWQSGTRKDEQAWLDMLKPWCVGGEWHKVPDDPAVLHWLWLIVHGLGQWKGVPATEMFARVIANNLRRAA